VTASRLEVRRLSQEEMRETVIGLLSGAVLSNHQVPVQDWPMVFLPVAFGCLNPPDEVVAEILGSANPPEIPDEPVPPPPDDPMWAYADEEMAEARKAREAAIKAHDEYEARYREVFSEWAEDVGAIVGNMKDALPRGINGYPMIGSIRLIHKDDWERIYAAVRREQDRAQSLVV
jgi:hypothetical protein